MTAKLAYNGEKPRSIELVANAARTATHTTDEFTPQGATGIRLTIVTTSPVSTPSVVFKVQEYDPGSATWIDITGAATAAVTTATTTHLTIDPRLTAAANVVVQRGLSERMRVVATHADADSITYGISVHGYR